MIGEKPIKKNFFNEALNFKIDTFFKDDLYWYSNYFKGSVILIGFSKSSTLS